MIHKALSVVAWWASAVALGLAAQAADDIQVTPIVAEGAVSASFAAAAAVGSDARALVESGLVVTLTFAVDLKRPASVWWDRTIHNEMVSSTIKLDTLSGMYHVSRTQHGHVTFSDRTKEFSLAREWSTSFDRISLATHAALDPNAEYYIEVRMTMSPRNTFAIWPFGADARIGRADFTFIR